MKAKEAGILGAAAAHPVLTGSGLLLGTAAVRGAMQANKHDDQASAQINAMHADPSLPVRKFASHYARYERFANLQKTAAFTPGQTFGQSMLGSFGESVTKNVAQTLFANPIAKAFDIIDKKLYLEPKQRNVFQQSIQSDPILARAMQETPEIVISSYKTLKQYGPSLTVDPNSVKNFLRQAVVMGGQIDFAMIKLLAETEKNIKASRGQIGAHL